MRPGKILLIIRINLITPRQQIELFEMQRLKEIESVTAKRRELHEMKKSKKGKSKKKTNFE